MKPVTVARCPGCGYENNPFFRYCGMCGHPLRAGEPPLPPVPQEPVLPSTPLPEAVTQFFKPELASEPPPPTPPRTSSSRPEPIAISGFSILGLGDPESTASDEEPEYASPRNGRRGSAEPTNDLGSLYADAGPEPRRDLNYLLEDDEQRKPWRIMLALILLAAAVGALVWHWQSNGYPWESAVRDRGHRPGETETTAETAAPAGAASSAANPSSSTPPSAAAAAAAAPTPVAAAPVVEAPLKPSPVPVQTALPPAPAEEPAAKAKPSPATKNKNEDEDAIAENEAAPAAKETPAAAPPVHARVPQVSPNDPAQLYTEGEKYLYGDGVPRDCDRAQRDLRTSAAHSNSQAESLLGTMYASGHCMGRDLPAAYRWYARALRHDPGNSRISSDLEVLWKQMTPAERQAAQAAGQ